MSEPRESDPHRKHLLDAFDRHHEAKAKHAEHVRAQAREQYANPHEDQPPPIPLRNADVTANR